MIGDRISGRGMKCAAVRDVSWSGLLLLIVLLFSMAVVSCTKAPSVSPYIPREPEKAEPPQIPELSKMQLWEKLVAENRHSPVNKKLATVNTFFNQFDFIDDAYLWGREDYWATLPETLSVSAGDCEDITIAKYFTLKDLDIPGDKMRLTYVYSLKTRKPHIVLTFQPNALQEPLVMDTMHNFLFPVSRRTDLVPVYSFNEYGYWIARLEEGWQGEHLGSPDRIVSWWSVLKRMKANRYVYSDG